MVDALEALLEGSADARPVILVVEDEFSLRWPASEYLRDSGYRVVEAASVAEAILVFSTNSRVDAVFSDINLNGELSGIDFSRWLHEHRPHVPMLITSGDKVAAQATATGPHRSFIAKPYLLAEVDRLLKSMLLGDG